MIRVLHVTEMLQAAGIESFIMNTYRHIDREKIQFDFLVTRNEKEFYDNEIKKLGGRKIIIDFMSTKSTFLRVIKESHQMAKILKNSEYNIIHVHSGTPLRIFYLIAAKKAGIKTRIYHSHSAEVKGPHRLLKIKIYIFKVLKQFFPRYATDYFACSKLAGQWMFPKRIQQHIKIIHNGIDSELFMYNVKIRKEYRRKLNVDDKIVIGHIGRFNEQKNHTFLIDVLYELIKENKNVKLMLIGTGELVDTIQSKIDVLNLNDYVMMLGVRSDISELFQVMDIFVLPSNYEGLPVVGIESQASGNLCLFSDRITPEIIITKNVKLLPIDSTEIWVKEILDSKNYIKSNTREEIIKTGYDISTTIYILEDFYINRR